MRHATYVYCLLRGDEAPDLAGGPAGLEGCGPPRLVEVDEGLWLVAADAPLDRYGEAQLARGLEDLEWVSRCALAHEGVVERLLGRPAVVPMKLFTLFASDERARARVRDALPRLLPVLDRLEGCEEWGVRIVRRRTAAPEPAPAGEEEGLSPGTAFLRRKQRARAAVREQAAAGRLAADDAYARLAAAAREAVRRPAGEGPRGEGEALLDAVFLVPREGAAFEEVVAAISAEARGAGMELALTGPWPPYHFVEGAL